MIPYDIRIDYTLKSGKTIRRYYDRAALWQLAELLKIEDSGEFRSAASSVIQGQLAQTLWNSEAFAAGNIYLADPYLSDISEIKLGENKRAQLLAAIASDMTAQSVEDRYFPEKDTVARLFFTLNGESDLETFGCNASNASVWLTSSYKETAALLSEWGVDVGIDGTGEMEHAESLGGIRQPEMEHAESLGDVQQPEMEHTESLGDVQQPEMEHAEILSDVQQPEIESITLQKFDPYASMNQISDPMSVLFLSYRSASDDDFPIQQDFGTRPQLTDSNQISEIAPALRSTYFMSGGGYIAAVKLSGSDQYIYKFLPYESAPDFINQKMQ